MQSCTGCHAAKTARKATAENAEHAETCGKAHDVTLARRLPRRFRMKDRLNATTDTIIASAIAVHRALGPFPE